MVCNKVTFFNTGYTSPDKGPAIKTSERVYNPYPLMPNTKSPTRLASLR
jgi:hypothetical protein